MMTKEGREELINSVNLISDGKLQSEAGCTATGILITKNKIYCANIGDSRTVLSKNMSAIDLSIDHKPDQITERRRIYKADSFVQYGRVNGTLSLSRALGDFNFKNNVDLAEKDQAVTAFPDVKITSRDPECEFIILACDGFWDCISSEKAV